MMSIVKWLERLSLDAVLVALCWCAALGSAVDKMAGPAGFAVLAMATWLAYVADRLWDVRPGTTTPVSERHLYYKNNYKAFFAAWLVLFVVAVLLAWNCLPARQFIEGWWLVFAVVLYLWLISRVQDFSRRLLLKRVLVPVLFTSGVAWMAESWMTPSGLAATAVLLVASLGNVLLISCQENRGNDLPPWVSRFAGAALVLHLVLGNGLLLVDWKCALAALYAGAVYYVLFIRIRTAGVAMIRMWTDATLADAALIILLLNVLLG